MGNKEGKTVIPWKHTDAMMRSCAIKPELSHLPSGRFMFAELSPYCIPCCHCMIRARAAEISTGDIAVFGTEPWREPC